mgnify:CR=1 FL=1
MSRDAKWSCAGLPTNEIICTRRRKSRARFARHVDDHVDRLAGAELGGIPLVTATSIRTGKPAVLIRKISQGNRSDHGAAALRTYLTTGQLPPLPDAPIAHG